MRFFRLLLAGLLLSLAGCGGVGGNSGPQNSGNPPPAPAPSPSPSTQVVQYVYVTHGLDSAISAFRMDALTGALTEMVGSPFSLPAPTTPHPVCFGSGCDVISRPVAADPTGRYIYEVDPDISGLMAFSITAASGALSPISNLPFDTGNNPEDVRIDPSGKFLYVDVVSPPGFTSFQIDQGTGALRSIPNSPFSASEDPFRMAISAQFLYAASTDVPGGVLGYAIGPDGALVPVRGSPFHAGQSSVAVAVKPSGDFLALVNDASSTISSFKIDLATGALTTTGSPVATGNNPSAIVISPQGFVYVSATEGIFGYSMDATGKLTAMPGGPVGSSNGSITVDAAGKFLLTVDAAQATIVTYGIDAATGKLTQASATPASPEPLSNIAIAQTKQ